MFFTLIEGRFLQILKRVLFPKNKTLSIYLKSVSLDKCFETLAKSREKYQTVGIL